ncbi:MAG: conjugal transfer protein TraX [Lachnospiraceae bacterium]|jgi:hypothetical protein|nr:conjugal transfer protein TraX [Lachnospiraceae bacterium]
MQKLSGTSLKWIAILAMIIDHVAWKLQAPVFILEFMHFIGRMTIPIMCFFIAEGFHHTRDLQKYQTRLFVFALIAQIPFSYFMTGEAFPLGIGAESLNVLFTLLFGLIAMSVLKSNRSRSYKALCVALCFVGSLFCDWFLFGILFILSFGLNDGNRKEQLKWFTFSAIICLFMSEGLNYLFRGDLGFMTFGLFATIPLFLLYNGKRSNHPSRNPFLAKWVFYMLYPLNLLVIGILHYAMGVI